MRISAISASMVNQCRKPHFDGKFGIVHNTDKSDVYYDHGMEADIGTYHYLHEIPYYPFLDESKDEIKSVLEQYNKYDHKPASDDPNSHDFTDRIDETIVKLMDPMPVTRQEYSDYIERKLLSKQEMNVEDRLKIAGLQIFLR